MQDLAALIAMFRPGSPTPTEVAQAFDVTRLDTPELTPAVMVLEQLGVKSAADLTQLLRLTSIDAALITLDWVGCADGADTESALNVLEGFAST